MTRVKDHCRHTRWFVYTSLTIASSATVLATSLAGGTPAATAAANPTIVSLTFDDGTISQYTLAWQRAIAAHGMNVTYFVPSGKIGSGPGYMTWDQLSTLFTAGNEIGGHTVDHVNLTGSTLTYDQKVHEVCDDRQALLQHGLDGMSFAYPEGAYDQTAEDIVRNCGYSSARAAGGVSASGPVYAETIPPLDVYATRTWTAPTPSTSPIQLSDMQAVVNAAASNGGGWVQIVIHRVCSQTYDSASYSDCLNSWRPMELRSARHRRRRPPLRSAATGPPVRRPGIEPLSRSPSPRPPVPAARRWQRPTTQQTGPRPPHPASFTLAPSR